MSELIINDESGRRNLKIEGGEIILGRSEECGAAVLKAQAVSRKHSRLFKEGPFYYIADLGSTNGTFVNGTKIAEKTALAHRDAIAIGQAKIEFYDEEGAMLEDTAAKLAGSFHKSPAAPDDMKAAADKLIGGIISVREKVESLNGKIPDTSQGTRALKNTLNIIADDLTVLAGAGELYDAINFSVNQGRAASPAEENAGERTVQPPIETAGPQNAPAKDYARVLEEINDIILKVEDYKKASKFILSVAMKIIDTNRGFIVVKDPTIGSIMPLVSEISSNEFAESSPSMLVAKHAINNREVIIVDDPMLDERFMGMSESIVSGIIKSVICLPFIKKGVCLGAIYMDNTRHKKNFSAGDREFVGALCEKVSGLLEKSGVYGELIDEYEQLGEKEIRAAAYLEQFAALRTGMLAEGIISESDSERIIRMIRSDAKSPILCMLDGGIAGFAVLEPFFVKSGVKCVRLNEQRVTASIAGAVPPDYALARAVLPFCRTMKKELYVAMADPLDGYTIAEIEKYSSCRIEAFYCEKDEIIKTLKSLI